ncbi:MAG: ATP-binding cassette domain-containing protein [Anaerolineae bacterium]|nr:ATP-binding cassette domain-containing protein [Anaerolineae bacterium]
MDRQARDGDRPRGLVRVEDLAYTYPRSEWGVRLEGLFVEPGEVVLVTGPSGCGKSTLARCIAGLIPHLYHGRMEGEVWLDGLSTARTPLWRLSERAGMVFQNPASQMIASSVEEEIVFGLENLGLSRADVRVRLGAALRQFGLAPLRARATGTLSGGEQQKVALAAIAARRPPILVLDEPLSMLDCVASEDLVAHLGVLARAGTAVIVCEHRVTPLRSLPSARTLSLGSFAADARAWQLPAEPFPGSGAGEFSLRVADLGVRLGERTVLDGLSFTAAAGQVIAVVGRNGAGKTTLLRALVGLVPYRGTIAAGEGRPDFALVHQNPDLQLFNATVREEVLYKVREPDMDRYRWLVRALGLGAYEDTPPLLLSEGQKKRLGLAVALMRAPRHGVLLDEPALGQDDVHKDRLAALARALADSGRLVIMTTHDLSLAARADRMLLLGDGRIAADGPPAVLLEDRAAWSQIGLTVPDWVLEEL